MALRCAHIECSELAGSSLLFKAEQSEVHLIDLADATAGIPLCAKHARSRTAPIGWSIIDLRTPTQAELWSPDAPPPDVNGPPERPPLRRESDREFAWGRAGEGAEGDGGQPPELDASSPLLSRAFGPLQR